MKTPAAKPTRIAYMGVDGSERCIITWNGQTFKACDACRGHGFIPIKRDEVVFNLVCKGCDGFRIAKP